MQVSPDNLDGTWQQIQRLHEPKSLSPALEHAIKRATKNFCWARFRMESLPHTSPLKTFIELVLTSQLRDVFRQYRTAHRSSLPTSTADLVCLYSELDTLFFWLAFRATPESVAENSQAYHACVYPIA